MGGAPSTLSGRQDAGQNSFSDSKFSASADSTSSPVPSTVGNTVGQQPAFNLGKFRLIGHFTYTHFSSIFSFHIHRCGCPAPHAAAWLRLFLWRSGRHAWPPVRRGRGGGRSLPWSAPRHPGAHSCWPHVNQPVPEQGGLRKQVMLDGLLNSRIEDIDHLCSFSIQLRNKLRQSRPESWPEQLWIREEQLRQ